MLFFFLFEKEMVIVDSCFILFLQALTSHVRNKNEGIRIGLLSVLWCQMCGINENGVISILHLDFMYESNIIDKDL